MGEVCCKCSKTKPNKIKELVTKTKIDPSLAEHFLTVNNWKVEAARTSYVNRKTQASKIEYKR